MHGGNLLHDADSDKEKSLLSFSRRASYDESLLYHQFPYSGRLHPKLWFLHYMIAMAWVRFILKWQSPTEAVRLVAALSPPNDAAVHRIVNMSCLPSHHLLLNYLDR